MVPQIKPSASPFLQQHRGDQRGAAAHLQLGVLRGHAVALGESVIVLPVLAISLVVLGIDDGDMFADADSQAVALDGRARSPPGGRPGSASRAFHRRRSAPREAPAHPRPPHRRCGCASARPCARRRKSAASTCRCDTRTAAGAGRKLPGRRWAAWPRPIPSRPCATAGAIFTIRRGSKGLGIR